MNAFVTTVPIESGRFGTVYKAVTSKGCTVAVKKLLLSRHDINKYDNQSMIHREYTNWTKVSGKSNIVKLYDFIIDDKEDAALFISEYCSYGTLQSRMSTIRDVTTIKCVLRDVLKGVQACHETDIAHCDLKPSNILLANCGTWKLADFGCSQHVTSYTFGLHARKGTPMFIAPEVFKNGESYGKSVDMWAIGVLAFLLLYNGLYPFTYIDNQQFINTVIKGNITWPNTCTAEQKDFIYSFLNIDSSARISCQDALKHPFLQEIEAT